MSRLPLAWNTDSQVEALGLMKIGEPELGVAMPLNCHPFSTALERLFRFDPNGMSHTEAATSLFRTRRITHQAPNVRPHLQRVPPPKQRQRSFMNEAATLLASPRATRLLELLEGRAQSGKKLRSISSTHQSVFRSPMN